MDGNIICLCLPLVFLPWIFPVITICSDSSLRITWPLNFLCLSLMSFHIVLSVFDIWSISSLLICLVQDILNIRLRNPNPLQLVRQENIMLCAKSLLLNVQALQTRLWSDVVERTRTLACLGQFATMDPLFESNVISLSSPSNTSKSNNAGKRGTKIHKPGNKEME